MLLFIKCEPHPKNKTFFKPFLAIFTLFHLKNLQLCKIFPSYIYGTPQVMFGLVNNDGKWCQMCCVIFHDWTFLVGMCGTYHNRYIRELSETFAQQIIVIASNAQNPSSARVCLIQYKLLRLRAVSS